MVLPEVAEEAMAGKTEKKERIQRLPLDTPFDLYASPKPAINQPQRETPGPPEVAEAAKEAKEAEEAMAAKIEKDQRIERLEFGTPFDLYASPRPAITPLQRQRDARKQWGLLNPVEKTVVEHVLRNGRVTLAELLRWMTNQGIDGGIETVRSITRTTNFLQGDDEGYSTNPEFKTQLEELIGS
jgi:hypothetical protein